MDVHNKSSEGHFFNVKVCCKDFKGLEENSEGGMKMIQKESEAQVNKRCFHGENGHFDEKIYQCQKRNGKNLATRNSEIIDKSSKMKIKCLRCFTLHYKYQCPAFGMVCSYCKKKNHFKIACLRLKYSTKLRTTELNFDSIFVNNVGTTGFDNDKMWIEQIIINGISFN